MLLEIGPWESIQKLDQGKLLSEKDPDAAKTKV